MEISVRQTNLPPNIIRNLLNNDIILVSHLNHFTPVRLSQKLKLKITECEEILDIIKPRKPHYIVLAAELSQRPFESIKSSFDKLDWLLGGGIKTGRITEISGDAGSGKSHLCTQLSIMTQLPVDHGGLDGEVLLIHTEGEGKLKLALRRFFKLAKSILEDHDLGNELNPVKLQDKIYVINSNNAISLIDIIRNRLIEFLDKNPKIKLIIIDSITCPFKSDPEITEPPKFDYYNQRSLKLTEAVKIMSQLAWDRRIAFVVTNHVAFDMKLGYNTPALGKIWSHMSHTKVYLERLDRGGDITRYAHVTKGAAHPSAPIPFIISNNYGLREASCVQLADIDHLLLDNMSDSFFTNEDEAIEYSEFELCTQMLYC